MITFKIATHVNNSVPVVELWEDNEMVGVIYPSDGRVRVISKFVSNVDIYMTKEEAIKRTEVEIRLSEKSRTG